MHAFQRNPSLHQRHKKHLKELLNYSQTMLGIEEANNFPSTFISIQTGS